MNETARNLKQAAKTGDNQESGSICAKNGKLQQKLLRWSSALGAPLESPTVQQRCRQKYESNYLSVLVICSGELHSVFNTKPLTEKTS